MLVIVSWVSFWLDKDAVPARVSLGVTTLLTMTTQASGINANLPPVSYTKAIDVWIGTCMAFIFGALLEFALVNYAGRNEYLQKERTAKQIHQPHYGNSGSGQAQTTAQQRFLTVARSMQEDAAAVPTANIEDNFPAVSGPYSDSRFNMRPLMTMSSPIDVDARNIVTLRVPKRRQRRLCPPCLRAVFAKYKERSKRIDVMSRIGFPIGFFFFNCIYWTFYLGR